MSSNLSRARRLRKAKQLACRILDVEQGASTGQLKSAWRTMCKKYHPDRRPGEADTSRRFRLVRQAYRCLRWGRGCERLLEMDGAEEAAADGESSADNNWAYFLWWRENFF